MKRLVFGCCDRGSLIILFCNETDAVRWPNDTELYFTLSSVFSTKAYNPVVKWDIMLHVYLQSLSFTKNMNM